ncbi:MAG: DUF192 domain-containing protein [Pseudomonadota bacterium]
MALARLIAAVCFGILVGGKAVAECAMGHADIQSSGALFRFAVEVRDTPQGRAQGLMHRETLPTFSGMLFVYERPQPVSFWMRNTLIPLDMLFMDASGTITRIARNAVPLDETPVSGGNDIQYVLEIGGGLAEGFGIEEGAVLRHPSLDQSLASWPCS